MFELWHDNQGIEMTEVAAVVAGFVIIAYGAWSIFGSALSNFVQGLPARLGMGG